MHRIFILDLHLDEQLPGVTRAFFRFLTEEAADCDELYILGDLFNYWISDRHNTPYQQEVAARLAQVKAVKYFLPGNRDFLIGKSYCRRCGMTLLKDPSVIEKNVSEPMLLCHGDSLCTLDHGYQKFRKFRSNPFYLFIFKCLPMSVKNRFANQVRTNAANEKKIKSFREMDIVDQDFMKLMDHHKVKICIHGHTHKPQVHRYEQEQLTRIVLGDWNEHGFDYLDEQDGRLELIHRPLC